MRRLVVPVVLILLLAAGFGWWWYQPERVVARRVASLFEAATVQRDDGNVTRGTRGSAIEGFLAPTVIFHGPEETPEEVAGPRTRGDIAALYAALARYCRQVALEDLAIDDVTVTGDEAMVRARIDAVIELPNNERPVDGIQHLDLTWRKLEGKWRLAEAKWQETGR